MLRCSTSSGAEPRTGNLACNACSFDTSGCSNPPVCGNGTQEFGEECDNGTANSDTLPDACRTDCSLPSCGDNVTDTGEECDDGNQIAGDGCDSACNIEVPPDCGNGSLDSGEDCDGENLNGKSCTTLGLGFTGGLTARSDYRWIPFPFILPVASIGTRDVSLMASYLPPNPGNTAGNVLFVFGKISLDSLFGK